MHAILITSILLLLTASSTFTTILVHSQPHVPAFRDGETTVDWLVDFVSTPVTLTITPLTNSNIITDSSANTISMASSPQLVLQNGLIARSFTLSPNFVTIDFRDLVSSRSLLRTVEPEANITLDGIDYGIGGLIHNGTSAYFDRTQPLLLDPTAFQFQNYW